MRGEAISVLSLEGRYHKCHHAPQKLTTTVCFNQESVSSSGIQISKTSELFLCSGWKRRL